MGAYHRKIKRIVKIKMNNIIRLSTAELQYEKSNTPNTITQWWEYQKGEMNYETIYKSNEEKTDRG